MSGPQVVEGWYGQPFAKPLARTRSTSGSANLGAAGPGHQRRAGLSAAASGWYRARQTAKSSIHPLRDEIPIYLAAEGPKNIALAGELCDGWLALFYSPYHDDYYREALNEGCAARRAAYG